MTTLRQLTYWLAVVEEASFTRAAARMHVSQPSLSQQVCALEREVGGQLLERLPRTVRLTAAGTALLPHATLAVQSAERGARAARAALQLQTGELDISTVRSIAVGLLPDLIQRWRRRHGDAVIRLHELGHRRLVEESVRLGRGDLGIGPPPRNWPGMVHVLGWEEFVIVLPTDELVGRRSIALTALANRDWVLFDRDNGLADITNAACAAAATPFRPRQAVLTSQVESAARLAAAGVGPALVPRNAVPRELASSVVSVDPPLGRELSVFARASWSPLAGAFLAMLREERWPVAPAGATLVG